MRYIPLMLILSMMIAKVSASDASQSHESILNSAKQYIVGILQQQGRGDFEIAMAPLDARLQLPLCGVPLQAFTTSNLGNSGYLTVGVRCAGAKPWSIYTSARVKSYQEVMVLTRPMHRGELVTARDLSLRRMEIADLRDDYFVSAKPALNQRLTRSLTAGSVLYANQLTPVKLVKRGEKIHIQAHTPYLVVKMSGEALMDGVKGQRIRVRNARSRRIIEGVVVARGVIQVGL